MAHDGSLVRTRFEEEITNLRLVWHCFIAHKTGKQLLSLPNNLVKGILVLLQRDIRTRLHHCFPNGPVKITYSFGLGRCGLRLEPRENALNHLEETDDIGTSHQISVVNLGPRGVHLGN